MAEQPSQRTARQQPAEPAPMLVLCPYCGRTSRNPDRCDDCGGLFEPLSRMATQIAMGPWFIRDKAQPFKPGCSYETLRRLVQAGRIHPLTVIRGPTTHQFWSIARNTPGVAHLVGFCHRCQEEVDPGSAFCPECSEPFEEPPERNELGLRFASRSAARRAQKELSRRLKQQAGEEPPPPSLSGDSTLTGQETGLLQASMDEAMDHLASADEAEATGYGMTLDLEADLEQASPLDTPPPPPDTSQARAAVILGKREDAPAPATPEPPTDAPAEREPRPLHPAVRFLLFLLAFLVLVAIGAALTYPLWWEPVSEWMATT